MGLLFALDSLCIPLVLAIRFVILTPVGMIIPGFQKVAGRPRVGAAHESEAQARTTQAVLSRVRRAADTCFVNTLRTLGAHAYGSDGRPLDRKQQFLDPIDNPRKSSG